MQKIVTLICARGHCQEIGIAALLFRLRPPHVERFQECQLTDVGESEFGKKNKKHAQNKWLYRVYNAHNSVFGSKRSAICAQVVYCLHSTRPSVT